MTASLQDVDHPLDAQPDAGPVPIPPAAVRDPGRPVREFEAVCMKHSLARGESKDLAPFLRTLGENKLLAMNFWSVVARLGEPKHGALSQQQVLAAIVRAVTGQSIEDANQSLQPDIDRLARLLAGEDVSLDSAPPVGTPELEAPAERTTATHPIEAQKSPLLEQKKEEAQKEAEQVTELAPPSLGSNATSSRLVLVPDHPRTLAAAIAAAPALAGSTAQPLSTEALPASRSIGPEPQRQPLEEPCLSIPLSSYARHDEEGKPARRAGAVVIGLAIAACLTFLIAEGAIAWRQPDNTAHAGIASLRQNIGSILTRFATAVHTGIASVSTHSPNPAPASAADFAATSSLPDAQPPSTELRTPPFAAPPQTPAPPRTPSRRAEPAVEGNTASAADDTHDSALVQISADEMHGHLISSRFPIVPDAAGADATTGVVTLEAVVTGRGTVEHAHAISGPPALRQPAIAAVSSWRYRPYLVDGAPTDVRTTIRVDFSGND